MILFRLFLVTCFVVILAYTSVTISQHGLNFFPVFFADIAEMGWPGQFNLDFLTLLILAALWVAWRHHFSAQGLILAVFMPCGGMVFLSAYLLIASLRCGGDVTALLLGERRARARS